MCYMLALEKERRVLRKTQVSLRFPRCPVQVVSPVGYVLADITRAYRCFADGTDEPAEATYVIRRRAGRLGCTRYVVEEASSVGVSIGRGRVMPALEREINQYLVGALGDHLLLHAAGVTMNNEGILLPGQSGSGKTTLAGGLVRQGHGYLTDELVILQKRTNRIIPFPKAFSIKEGSFGLFEALGPDPTGPEYDRVWYIDPERLRPGSVVKKPAPIAWVVFPHYEAGSDTRLERLTVGETVVGLFENAVNIDRHKRRGLDRLVTIAKRAPGYRLVFGDLAEACRLIMQIAEPTPTPCS